MQTTIWAVWMTIWTIRTVQMTLWAVFGQTPSGSIFMLFKTPWIPGQSSGHYRAVLLVVSVSMSYRVPNSEFGAGVMARKLPRKVWIRNCPNGHLNSPNGHPNGPNGPIGCLYQASCKFPLILVYSDSSDSVPILKEVCSMWCDLCNEKPDQEAQLFVCFHSRIDTLLVHWSILYALYMLGGGKVTFLSPKLWRSILCFVFALLSVSRFQFMVI